MVASEKSELTLIESWRNVNVLLFYRNFQEIVLLDRFLANNSSIKMSQFAEIGFARKLQVTNSKSMSFS
jgi:hypothetical protein